MSAEYWIAKYIEDPMRNEPRNVGVFVKTDSAFVARFVGEREDGHFDLRKLGNKFLYPDVYSQWRAYWRAKTLEAQLDDILQSTTANFFVERGGEVADTDGDAAVGVCNFMYHMIVGDGPIAAHGWESEVDAELGLSSEIIAALTQLNLLQDGLLVRHPIRRDHLVQGRTLQHTPSFSQRNGRLYLIDHIDLASPKITKIKERAGYIGYMFEDIKGFEKDAKAYSIVRPPEDDHAEAVDYARAVLRNVSEIVDWSNPGERANFLKERENVADAA